MSDEIRPLFHELLNALSISRGLSEGVLAVLRGDIELSTEAQISKLERAVKSMDRLEAACKEIREIIVSKD